MLVIQVVKATKTSNYYLGRPYRMRIAVTSQRAVSLYGCALVSLFPVPSLGLLEN